MPKILKYILSLFLIVAASFSTPESFRSLIIFQPVLVIVITIWIGYVLFDCSADLKKTILDFWFFSKKEPVIALLVFAAFSISVVLALVFHLDHFSQQTALIFPSLSFASKLDILTGLFSFVAVSWTNVNVLSLKNEKAHTVEKFELRMGVGFAFMALVFLFEKIFYA